MRRQQLYSRQFENGNHWLKPQREQPQVLGNSQLTVYDSNSSYQQAQLHKGLMNQNETIGKLALKSIIGIVLGILALWITKEGTFYFFLLFISGLLFFFMLAWGNIKWKDVNCDCQKFCGATWIILVVFLLVITFAPSEPLSMIQDQVDKSDYEMKVMLHKKLKQSVEKEDWKKFKILTKKIKKIQTSQVVKAEPIISTKTKTSVQNKKGKIKKILASMDQYMEQSGQL